MIARFTFTEGGDGHYAVTKAEAIPTRIDLSGPAVTLVNTAAHRDAEDNSYRRVVDVLNRRGAAAQGLIISDQ